MIDVLENLLSRSSWGVILASGSLGYGAVVAVLVALLVAAIVGVVLHLLDPTRPYAGPAAILTFLVLLLLLLL
jgi:hypothetical protein